MFKSRFFIAGVFFLIIVAVIHISAIYLNWYFRISWIDNVIHFLAGISVSCAFLASVEGWLKIGNVSQWRVFFLALISVLFVGIIWEIFEYSCDLTFYWLQDYPLDTAMDLIADISGATIPFLFIKERKNE